MAACGDDNGDSDACVGHTCETPGLSDPEGGNILFEYIYLDSELKTVFGNPAGGTINRIIGYFMNGTGNMDSVLPTPGQCMNLDGIKGWPMFIPPAREELDVGNITITGKNTAGTAVTINVPKKMNAAGERDSIGRTHNLYYQILQSPAANFIKGDEPYTVSFSGSDKVAAFTFQNGLFLAKDFAIPDVENNGPLVPGTNFTVTWTPATSANLPAGGTVLGVTWLADSNGSPTHLCAVGHDAGTFTIPGATITQYKQVAMARGTNPNKVVLLRNAVVHQVSRLPNNDAMNKRRIDMVTVNCWAQLMDVQ